MLCGAVIWDRKSSRWSLSGTQHIRHHGEHLPSCLHSRFRLQISSESGLSSSPSDVSDTQSHRADWYKASFGAHRTPPPAWKMCPELFSCPLMPLWPTQISSSLILSFFSFLTQCFFSPEGDPSLDFWGVYDDKFISAVQAYEWHRLTGLFSSTFMNSIWNNITKATLFCISLRFFIFPTLDMYDRSLIWVIGFYTSVSGCFLWGECFWKKKKQ